MRLGLFENTNDVSKKVPLPKLYYYLANREHHKKFSIVPNMILQSWNWVMASL